MEGKLKMPPPFVTGVWVTGVLTSKDEFIGRTSMLTNRKIGVVAITKLGEAKILTIEFVKSYREIDIPLTLADSKFKFNKGIWVTGSFDKKWFIGVTCIRNQKEVIALVTQSCQTDHIPFEYGRNLKELFLSAQDITHSITRSNYDKTNINIDDKLVVEITLNLIYNKN